MASQGWNVTDGVLNFSGPVSIVGTLTTSSYAFSNGGFIFGVSDGVIEMANAAGTGFSRLMFGGTTNSFPAIKRSGTELHSRLADDSAFANFRGEDFFSTGANGYLAAAGGFFYWNGRSAIKSPSDGTITLSNAAVTDFVTLQFGGTTNAFPALRRTTTTLECILADASNYADFLAKKVGSQTSTALVAGGALYFYGSTASMGICMGSGLPTLSAAKGSLYLRSDGTTTNDRAYINTNGSTWTALTTAA
jgi:hypothetical protein